MSSESEQLKQRTMAFALKALQLVDKIPSTHSGQVVGRQLAKSATSVSEQFLGNNLNAYKLAKVVIEGKSHFDT